MDLYGVQEENRLIHCDSLEQVKYFNYNIHDLFIHLIKPIYIAQEYTHNCKMCTC